MHDDVERLFSAIQARDEAGIRDVLQSAHWAPDHWMLLAVLQCASDQSLIRILLADSRFIAAASFEDVLEHMVRRN